MIKLELSQTELDDLVRAIGKLFGYSFLDKLENFRLQDGNRIAFDQSIKLSTTPLIELSVDSSGRLLIDIIRLADSWVGGGILWALEGFVTKKIADATKGFLQKESSSQLSLTPSNVLPLKTRFKKVSIQNQKLFLELSTD